MYSLWDINEWKPGRCTYYRGSHKQASSLFLRMCPVCTHASACRIDVLVEELFLSLMNVATVELSATYDQKLQEEAKLVDRQWQEKLQRLSYQADLARRRYEAVDPANRLVAATLETEWYERLVELEGAKAAHQAARPTEAHVR